LSVQCVGRRTRSSAARLPVIHLVHKVPSLALAEPFTLGAIGLAAPLCGSIVAKEVRIDLACSRFAESNCPSKAVRGGQGAIGLLSMVIYCHQSLFPGTCQVRYILA
jgi:hypothetical protein